MPVALRHGGAFQGRSSRCAVVSRSVWRSPQTTPYVIWPCRSVRDAMRRHLDVTCCSGGAPAAKCIRGPAVLAVPAARCTQGGA